MVRKSVVIAALASLAAVCHGRPVGISHAVPVAEAVANVEAVQEVLDPLAKKMAELMSMPQ